MPSSVHACEEEGHELLEDLFFGYFIDSIAFFISVWQVFEFLVLVNIDLQEVRLIARPWLLESLLDHLGYLLSNGHTLCLKLGISWREVDPCGQLADGACGQKIKECA